MTKRKRPRPLDDTDRARTEMALSLLVFALKLTEDFLARQRGWLLLLDELRQDGVTLRGPRTIEPAHLSLLTSHFENCTALCSTMAEIAAVLRENPRDLLARLERLQPRLNQELASIEGASATAGVR